MVPAKSVKFEVIFVIDMVAPPVPLDNVVGTPGKVTV
jgi:hypothetical protein